MNLIKKFKETFQDKNLHLPINPRQDDVYIVEFPKSGITWLSTLIANVNALLSEMSQKPNFFNIFQFVPDIHISREIPYFPIYTEPKFRFIKSHSYFTSDYNQVIYLLRNPFDVMKSYYTFITGLNKFNGSFQDFVLHKTYGIKCWVRHVNEWLLVGDDWQKQRLHFIKYEDLIRSSESSLHSLYKSLGYDLSGLIIKSAILNSDIIKMKADEKWVKNYNPSLKLEFVKKNQKIDLIDDESKNIILKESIEIIKKFYPQYI